MYCTVCMHVGCCSWLIAYFRRSIEESALVDKTFIDQRLEDERAKEEHLAEETTYVINKFTSAKDRHEVIKSFKRRY